MSFIWKASGSGRLADLSKVSHVTVYNWIRGFGQKLEELRSAEAIEIVEMDGC